MNTSDRKAKIATTLTKPLVWLSVQQVAERLDCCDRTVRLLIREGSFPARKFLTRRFRVLESDLEAYMNEAPKFKPKGDSK